MENKRIYNIDLFRIYFTLIILVGHIIGIWIIPALTATGQSYTNIKTLNLFNGSAGYVTDCFFIMAGYFMYNTFLRASLKELILSKFIRLWPALFMSVMFCFVLHILKISTFNKIENLLMLMFIGRGIFEIPLTEIGVAWYVSSLFCSFVILYLLSKLFPNKTRYIFSLIAIFCYSALFNKGNPYSEPLLFNNFISFFLMRGIAGLSTGWLLFYFCKETNFHINKLLATSIELFSLILFIFITFFKRFNYNYPVIILSFCFIFFLFVKKAGYISIFFDKPVFSIFAKPTYTIFILQENIFRIFGKYIYYTNGGGYDLFTWLLLPVIVSVFSGILVYLTFEKLIRKILLKVLGK